MDIQPMTDEQLQEKMKELREQRDEIIVQLGALSTELLARQAPNQATILPFIRANPGEGW